jgi:hypothetical protein
VVRVVDQKTVVVPLHADPIRRVRQRAERDNPAIEPGV